MQTEIEKRRTHCEDRKVEVTVLQEFCFLLQPELGARKSVDIRIVNEKPQQPSTTVQDCTKLKENRVISFSTPII